MYQFAYDIEKCVHSGHEGEEKMSHAVVYEYADIEQFFRSCALAICMQRSLEVNWVPYKDSRVLNTLYGMKSVLWGAVGKEAVGPGAVEVTIASRQELADEIEQKTNDFVQTWLKKLHEHGPDAAHAYVDRIGDLRNFARYAQKLVTPDQAAA